LLEVSVSLIEFCVVKRGNKILKGLPGRIVIVSLLFFAACTFAQAQVKFSASAPKSTPVNQQFQLNYTVENGSASAISSPALTDLKIVGGPYETQSFQFNGKLTRSTTYSYVVQPIKEGTFKIGKATAKIEGVNMESNELTITVTGPVKQQAQRRDPFDPFGFFDQDPFQQQTRQPSQKELQDQEAQNQKILKQNVFIRLVPGKGDLYVGERTTATLRLYFSAGYGIANCALSMAPSFESFWSQDVQMPKGEKPRQETINGQKYNVVDIQIYNLYPQRAGTLKSSSAQLEIIVQAPVNNFIGYQNFRMKADCPGIAFNVKDLPTAGKPKDFAGAVGQYTYSAKLSSSEDKTDNAVTYSVIISGTGNLKTIALPKPEFPDGFEVFDPKVKDDVTNSAAGMSGSKQYDYLVIPRQPGDYKIPASSFSYFDPSAGRYISLSSPELSLKVTGEPSQNPNSGTGAVASKEDISALHSDIRYIKTKAGDLNKGNRPFFGSVAYIGLLATPFLLFIGLIFVKRRNEDLAADLVGAKRRRATKLAKKRLSAAEKHLSKNDKPAFYDEVSRAIWGYLGDKLNIDQSQLSKDNVEEKLLSKNVKTESIAKLKGLIHTCEIALYAPVGGEDEMKQDYNIAVALITDLEDEIKQTRDGGRGTGDEGRGTMDIRFPALVLCIILYSLFSIPSLHAESPTGLFTIGADAYKAKNYRQAIDAYQKLISEGYRNAEVYYNLGNSYYKTGQISLAILNYERAHRLAPSDEDIHFNLKLANLKTVDRIIPVPQLSIVSKWQNFIGSQCSGTWAIFSVVSAWLALVAFALYLFAGSIRKVGFYSGIALLFFAMFFFYLSYTQDRSEYGDCQAILTTSNAYIKSAPDASGTDLFMVHEGVKLNILDRVGEWSKVRLADGKVGWVEQGTFSVI
jgi:tetratricopeptide (TPR) repeat protein